MFQFQCHSSSTLYYHFTLCDYLLNDVPVSGNGTGHVFMPWLARKLFKNRLPKFKRIATAAAVFFLHVAAAWQKSKLGCSELGKKLQTKYFVCRIELVVFWKICINASLMLEPPCLAVVHLRRIPLDQRFAQKNTSEPDVKWILLDSSSLQIGQ